MSATQSHRSEQRRLRVARKNACMGSCAPLRLWRMKRRLLSEKCRAEAASAKAISLANVSRVSEAVPISGTQHRRCEPRSLSRMDVCQWRVDRGRGSRCPPSSKACLQSNAAREKRRSRAVMCIQQLDCTTWAWGGGGGGGSHRSCSPTKCFAARALPARLPLQFCENATKIPSDIVQLTGLVFSVLLAFRICSRLRVVHGMVVVALDVPVDRRRSFAHVLDL